MKKMATSLGLASIASGVLLFIIILTVIYYSVKSCFVSPITKEEYGHATWIYLHGVVASLPAQATVEHLNKVQSILQWTFESYPCLECRFHILDYLADHPVPSASKREMQDYLFVFHNRVNVLLGKSIFTREAFQRQWSRISDHFGTFACHTCSPTSRR